MIPTPDPPMKREGEGGDHNCSNHLWFFHKTQFTKILKDIHFLIISTFAGGAILAVRSLHIFLFESIPSYFSGNFIMMIVFLWTTKRARQ